MKKLLTLTSLALAVLPAVAAAQTPDNEDRRNAARECRAERAAMGAENFRNTYGTNRNRRNAFGKCVSRRARDEAREEGQAHRNASRDCRAERSDPNFAATHGGQTFEQFYGTGPRDRNAFGRCVSMKARANEEAADAEDQERINAARACRAEQRANPAQFAADYGTRRNAFGKCVSQKAREQND
jgi:hypothetical protein